MNTNSNVILKYKSDKNQIDLISLDNFLLDKLDDYLDILFQIKNLKKVDTKNIKTLNYIITNIKDYSINKIPDELWSNYYFCDKLMSIDGDYLKYVSENLRDYNLCKKAVFNSISSLVYVPTNLKEYYSICEEIVSINGYALGYIPTNLRDYNLCEKAVSNKGETLFDVPEHLRDYNLCKKAVIQDNDSIDFVPQDIPNYYKLLKFVVKKKPEDMYYLITNNILIISEIHLNKLKKDFPEYKEYFSLQEYISKEVKKLLKEYYLKEK